MTAFTSRAAFSVADLELFDPQSSTRTSTRTVGRERRFLCPLCGDGKPKDAAHRSLCANLESGAWNCKRCKATGKLSDFWQDHSQAATNVKISGRNRVLDVARHKRRQLSALPLQTVQSEPQTCAKSNTIGSNTTRELRAAWLEQVGTEKLVEVGVKKSANDWRDQLGGNRVLDIGNDAAPENYLRSRGIDIETAIAAGTTFAPNFYGRGAVAFPICERDGQQIGASGRYFHANATPKTRIVGTKKNGLFATSGALTGETIIVTEAPIDALSLASVGFAAVALCGTSAPTWIHLACGLKHVLLAFDADEAGDNAATALAVFLAPYGARCSRLRPEGAKDWNEALQRDSGALRAFVAAAIEPPRECVPRDLYDPPRAYAYAAKLLRHGAITREQCDYLQRDALEASKVRARTR